ncbi:Thiosulfate:glutathione sulfurtransferase [Merluccius polli]|uniref:Thiosulfate:glutathione sulfurtransferase n=1 Tax=Merluccius polli TaxID=89951 RepID=A0AA47ME30_MERPO|nr:Thiosulfate:glutathione sulfurtransferase [Merluccius polli]
MDICVFLCKLKVVRGFNWMRSGALMHLQRTCRGSYVTGAPFDKTQISYADLKALLEKSQSLILVDVRTKEEVDKGCIPGSIHVPVDTVETAFALDPAEFKAKYGVAKPSLDAPELVFHCQMGRRGQAATDKALLLGFQR